MVEILELVIYRREMFEILELVIYSREELAMKVNLPEVRVQVILIVIISKITIRYEKRSHMDFDTNQHNDITNEHNYTFTNFVFFHL